MKRLALFLALLLCFPASALADHQVTFSVAGYGELSTYNPVIRELRQSGVFRWHCQTDLGQVDGCADAIMALEGYSAREGVLMVYDPNGTPLISSGGNAFLYGTADHGGAGVSWAIGFVDTFPGNPKVVVDATTMQTWPLSSRLEVWFHELLHTLANSGEGYLEGYVYGTTSCAPIDDGGVFVGFHRSLMNCGLGNSQKLDTYTDYIWRFSHYPSPVHGASLIGRTVWYAATTPNASLVAVIADIPNQGRALVAVGSPCTAPGYACGVVGLPVLPKGTAITVKAQNALFIEGQEVFAGVVP